MAGGDVDHRRVSGPATEPAFPRSDQRNVHDRVLGLALRAVLAAMLLLVAAPMKLGAAAGSERQLVFLIDVSKSMTSTADPITKVARPTTLEQELRGARNKAEEILKDLGNARDIRVSFWSFGEKDRLGPIETGLTPGDAFNRLDALFSPERARFNHDRTYIAYSLFQVTGKILGLPNWTPDRDIPNDTGLFVMVLTDGAEDHDRGFDNKPYEEWQARQQRHHQLVWQKWTLFKPQPPERPTDPLVTYAVVMGQPTDVPLNLASLPADDILPLPLDRLPRTILLVPQLMGGGTVRTVSDGRGDYRTELVAFDVGAQCVGEAAPPAALGGATLRVQADVDWRPAGGIEHTPEWSLVAPARPLIDGASPPRRSLETLRLQIGTTAGAVVPDRKKLAVDQRFAVRLKRDQLCSELKRAYPSSRFVFPVGDADPEPPLAAVHVYERDTLRFALEALEGNSPAAELPAIVPDRWHRYSRSTRSVRLTPAAGVRGAVDYSITVKRDGKDSSDARDLVALAGAGGAGGLGGGLSVTVPMGQVVTLAVPPEPQTWLKSAFGRGLREPAGAYSLALCATPRIESAPTTNYEVVLDCPSCPSDAVSKSETRICVNASVAVQGRKISWWTIGLLTALALVAAWVWWRWTTRPQFRGGFMIGNLRGEHDIRSAQAKGTGGAKAMFCREPGYIQLLPQGRTIFFRKFIINKDRNQSVIVGVRPNPVNPNGGFLLWCAAKPASEVVDVRFGVTSLTPIGARPKTSDPAVLRVSYSSVGDRPTIDVRRGEPALGPQQVESYQISIVGA